MLDPGGDLDWRAMESCRDAYAFCLLFCVRGGAGVGGCWMSIIYVFSLGLES